MTAQTYEAWRISYQSSEHAARAAFARMQEMETAESRTISQRDHCEEVIDRMADAVLGTDRREWSSAYDFMDAAAEVDERIAQLEAQATQAQRMLLMSDSSKVISEKELERAFAGTNFGTTDHREILHTAMLKKACGYHCGHTITEIMKELRLIGHKGALLKRGIEFLRASYHKQMLDGA